MSRQQDERPSIDLVGAILLSIIVVAVWFLVTHPPVGH